MSQSEKPQRQSVSLAPRVARRVKRWVNNVAHGKDDRRQSFTKAEFVDGGTVGPAPRAR